MKRIVATTFACALLWTACKKEEPKEKVALPVAPAASASAAAPAAAAAGKKESDDVCVGPLAAGSGKQVIELGGQTYERNGYTLTRTSSDADGQVVLGIMSDVKEETEDNLKNVTAALEFFKAQKAEAIVFLGDSSETKEGVVKVLKAIAAGGLPVFAVVGNRECRLHWKEGMAEAQKDAKNLFDFTQIRLFNSNDVSIISMPGYYNPTYLHCTDGCRYFPSDVEGLSKLLKEATAAPLLISHGPPRQEGANAVDRIHDGANVGDPVLGEFLAKNPIPFGAFANIGEAGGKATDLSGKNVIAQDTMVNSLYLNPGFMDSIAWQMLDGTTSTGMAAVMTIKGRQASYKIKRFGAAPADPKAPAPKK